MKNDAPLLTPEEAVFALRLSVGSFLAWGKALESMRNDDYSYRGLRLLPVTRVNDGYGWRPRYDGDQLKAFIDDINACCPEAERKRPVRVERGDYDPGIFWKLQKSTVH